METTTGKGRRSLWDLGPVARSCLALAVLLLISVALAPSQAAACPACARYECVVHVQLDGLTTKERFEGFEASWSYSEKCSTKIIKTHDQDGDQTLSTKELAEAQAALWAEAENNRFCLIMVTGGEPVPVQGGRRPELRIREGMAVLSFEVLVGQPIEEGSQFRFYFSDPGGKIKFIMIEPLFWPETIELQVASGPWRLDYEMDWSELVTITFSSPEAPGPGPVEARTGETTPAGADLSAARPDEYGPGRGGGLTAWLGDVLVRLRSRLEANFRELKSGFSLGPVFVILFISFLHGAAHNAGPGHGKTLMAAYLAANPVTFRRATAMSMAVGAIHAFTGLAVGTGVYALIRFVLPISEAEVARTSVRISALLIIGVAVYLLYSRIRGGGHLHLHLGAGGHHPQNDHDSHLSDSDHHHQTDHHSDHAGGARADAVVVLASGIVPCPGLVTVFLFCLAVEMYLMAVLAAVAMSLGAALVMLVVTFLTLVVRRQVGGRYAKITVYLSYVGPVIILILGLVLLLAAPEIM